MTLEKHFARLDKVLIGLWRFRHSGSSGRQWCCTWCYLGEYYDTYPKPTPEKALGDVWRNWQRAKKSKEVKK